MTTESTERDLIEEVEELLANPTKRVGRTGYVYELLRRMVEEVKRLRTTFGIEEAELNDIRDCEKCDLCEDHHD